MTGTERRQIQALADLMRLEPPRFLLGGWAEDAVLHGKPSRVHRDIDLMVPLDELPSLIEQVEALGFRDPHLKFQIQKGKPIVVAVFRDDVEVELIAHQVAKDGRAFYDLPVGDKVERLWLPPDAFTHKGRIHDVEVRTVTPLALYQIREFLQHVFGGMRDTDRVSQAKLKAAYFAKTPEKELRVRQS